MKKDQTGHHFLARLGKTRLRPGGRFATEWLINQTRFAPDTQVLEVACNMCTTAVGLAQRFGCHITGVDLDENALNKARQNIRAAGLEHLVQVQHANATELPFPDNSFDVVINEAMLTMLPLANKEMAVAEYFRVLKPGGTLLVLEFSKVAKPLAPAYDLYSFKLLPLMGKLIAKDADSYQYLAESIRMHPDQETLKQMMLNAGFDSVDYHNMSAGIVALHKGVKF